MLTYLLDTDICIYVIKNRPPALREKFNAESARLCTSAVTAYELVFGAENSARPGDNLNVVESFLARLTTLPFDEKAAVHAGQIRADLTRRGRIIGPYDLMIAGLARSEGLIVVTNNAGEFARVEGVRVENWVDMST